MSSSSASLLVDESAPPAFTHSPARWSLLLAFSLSNAANAFLWIAFSPAYLVFVSFWGVSSLDVTQLSNIFMATFLPGTLIAAVSMERFGLRATLIGGAVANAAGAWLRYGGGLIPTRGGFVLAMAGQTIASLAQPIFTNAPARISADWFPRHQRDMATVIAALSNAVGTALGSALPGFLVNANSDVAPFLLGQAGACSALLCLSYALIRSDRPPMPPSAAAERREVCRLKGEGIGGVPTYRAAVGAVLTEYAALLRSRNFVYLVIGFSVGLGVFNALLTLLAQVLSPCGYDADTASLAGGALLVSGLVSAGIAGVVLERTHAYVTMLRCGIALAGASLLFFLSSLRPGVEAAIISASALLGLCLLPLLPIALENAAECTYPASEDVSSGLLLVGGNYVGLILIFVLQPLLSLPVAATCSSLVTPSAGVVAAVMAVAGVSLFLFKKDYKRQAVERAAGGTMEGDSEGAY